MFICKLGACVPPAYDPGTCPSLAHWYGLGMGLRHESGPKLLFMGLGWAGFYGFYTHTNTYRSGLIRPLDTLTDLDIVFVELEDQFRP